MELKEFQKLFPLLNSLVSCFLKKKKISFSLNMTSDPLQNLSAIIQIHHVRLGSLLKYIVLNKYIPQQSSELNRHSANDRTCQNI